jgi:hypothetical protein
MIIKRFNQWVAQDAGGWHLTLLLGVVMLVCAGVGLALGLVTK